MAAADISSLRSRYLKSCHKHQVPTNSSIISWFSKAEILNLYYEKCCMVVYLDKLKDDDYLPLIDVFLGVESSNIDAVDVVHGSPCSLNLDCLMSLMHLINPKLRRLHLLDIPFKEDLIRDLNQDGLACQLLALRSRHIQGLNISGKFMHLHTLCLDFCSSLTSLHKDCFSGMPNLARLSMCETRISNLWTTSAMLAKLPSLSELRFQACLYCEDTGFCPSLLDLNAYPEDSSDTHNVKLQAPPASDLAAKFVFTFRQCLRRNDTLSDKCEAERSNHFQNSGSQKLSYSILPKHTGQAKSNKVNTDDSATQKKYAMCHPSPICFEKHYREYMVASLPHLKVLDNLLIIERDRETSRSVYLKFYEYLPYRRRNKENVSNILLNRETGTGGLYCQKSNKPRLSYPRSRNQCFFSRSLAAAKVGSTTWPLIQPMSNVAPIFKESKRLRPRQFEYHPSDSNLMAFGTLDGEIFVINPESGNTVGQIPSTGGGNSVLGLSWLKKYPSKLVAGYDDGSLRLFDIGQWQLGAADRCFNAGASTVLTYDKFERLTSVNVNSTDDQFLATGFSRNVSLYDINGRCLQTFTGIHREPINVAKFSHHSPFMFATSSFDHEVKMWDLRQKPIRACYTASSLRGNVMVCFSPDDLYLLVSAVDNEVKQLLAADGRPHMSFDIAPTGSAHNYTRSYYMNGRDYIISGSSDENIVRVCCAQTGRRLRDIYLEDNDSGNSMFVQTLRGDPFRDFHMSILVTSKRPSTKWDIIKVNLLASEDCS